MKLVVFGASGATGQYVCRIAQDAGWLVHAFVRSHAAASKLDRACEHSIGDPTDLPRFFGPVITGERQPSVSWLNTLAVQTHSGSDSLGYCGVEPRCNAVATAR